MRKPLYAALLVGGLILLFFGYQEYQSFSSEVEQFFTGSPSDKSLWMIIGGAAAVVSGIVGLTRSK